MLVRVQINSNGPFLPFWWFVTLVIHMSDEVIQWTQSRVYATIRRDFDFDFAGNSKWIESLADSSQFDNSGRGFRRRWFTIFHTIQDLDEWPPESLHRNCSLWLLLLFFDQHIGEKMLVLKQQFGGKANGFWRHDSRHAQIDTLPTNFFYVFNHRHHLGVELFNHLHGLFVNERNSPSLYPCGQMQASWWAQS